MRYHFDRKTSAQLVGDDIDADNIMMIFEDIGILGTVDT